MTTYAAAGQVQPLVQGVLRVDPDSLDASFQGRGVSSIVKNGLGDFTLLFDQGVEGAVALDSSITPSIPGGVAGAVPVFGRVLLTLRGSPTNATPGSTSITQKSVNYVTAPNLGAVGIRIVLSIAGAGTDPTGDDADGCEVIVFRANTAADNFTQQIFGPLYGN